MKDELRQQLHSYLSSTPQLMQQILSITPEQNFKRQIHVNIEQLLHRFLNSTKGCQWIIMPGLRGVGKTTLLAQLYNDPLLANYKKFYLSLDIMRQLGANTLNIEQAIKEQLESEILDYEQPFFVFFDEVHYLPEWSLGSKLLYDHSRRICLICTGAPALDLHLNADVARRADIMTMHPLSFTEFIASQQTATQEVEPINTQLSSHIKDALFNSPNVDEAGQRLQTVLPEIQAYWSKMPHRQVAINQYLQYGFSPAPAIMNQPTIQALTLPLDNLSTIKKVDSHNIAIWQQIIETLHIALLYDVASIKEFNSSTLTAFLRLLTSLTYVESKSLAQLSEELHLNINTIQEMLATLCLSQVLLVAKPQGAGRGHVRKPNKYLFASPALRSAMAYSLGRTFINDPLSWSQFRQRLLEDLVASSMKRVISYMQLGGTLEYDAAQQGADLILNRSFRDDAIVIEVGMNQGNANRAMNTLRKGGRYGLIVNDDISSNTPTNYYKVDSKNKLLTVSSAVFLLL